MRLTVHFGAEGQERLRAIFQRHGVEYAAQLDKSQDAVVVSEIEAAIAEPEAALSGQQHCSLSSTTEKRRN